VLDPFDFAICFSWKIHCHFFGRSFFYLAHIILIFVSYSDPLLEGQLLDVIIREESKYFWINLTCGRHISTLSEVWGLISCKACFVVDLSKYWHYKWKTEVNELARRTGESPLSVVSLHMSYSIAQILYNTPTGNHGGYIFRWLPIFMFCSCCCSNSGPLFLLVKRERSEILFSIILFFR